MISTGDLRKGIAIELDGELWQILDYHHIKMGRGSAQVRIKLRNVKRGQTVERTLPGRREVAARVPRQAPGPVPVPRRRRLPLHGHGVLRAVLADAPSSSSDAANYLKDGMTLDRTSYEGETIGVELPITVDLRSTDTEPGFAGDTAAGRAQAGDDRDRARRPGAALRERGRHDPHRHPHRRVPDPGLTAWRAAPEPIARMRLEIRARWRRGAGRRGSDRGPSGGSDARPLGRWVQRPRGATAATDRPCRPADAGSARSGGGRRPDAYISLDANPTTRLYVEGRRRRLDGSVVES